MRKLLFLFTAFSLFSCGKKEDAKTSEVSKTDTIKKQIASADEDTHGCKASAGYTWSDLRGECVRIFEVGTLLKASGGNKETQMPAFVIFKDDKAEVFIQTEKPFVMEREANSPIYKYGDWEMEHVTHANENGKVTKLEMIMLGKKGLIMFFKPSESN